MLFVFLKVALFSSQGAPNLNTMHKSKTILEETNLLTSATQSANRKELVLPYHKILENFNIPKFCALIKNICYLLTACCDSTPGKMTCYRGHELIYTNIGGVCNLFAAGH